MYNVHIVLNMHKTCGLGLLFFIYFHHIFQQMKSIVFSAQLVEMFQGFFHLMENSVWFSNMCMFTFEKSEESY